MSELIINSGVSQPQHFVKTKGGLRLRVIKSENEMEDVYRLTYECYVAKGYCLPNSSGKLIHYPHLDGLPETSVLVVEDESGDIVGTSSTTIDNPNGLHVDEDFLSESNQVRKEGGVLASSWRIAVDHRHRASSRVARILTKGSVEFWHHSNIDVCLMSLAPCHVSFYQRFGNGLVIGKRDGLKDIRNTAAVLIRWDRYRCPFAEQFNTRVM